MKKIYLSLVMVFGLMAVNTKAQMSSYLFTPSAGTFTPITGGTAVSTATSVADFLGDTKTSISIPLGFNFKFNGVNYASVIAMSDGFISFNPLATSLATNNLATSTANSRPLVAPLWDDLDGASGTGTAYYKTEGAVGSRIFTMEWLNWQWNWGATGATISFQVKLYEGSNAIEFIYQQEAGALNSPTASIGIAAIGTGSGNFISLNNSTAAPTTSTATETTGINLKPATGQVYRFEQNPVPVVMDYVNLQFPQTATIAIGGSETIYTQGYEPGVTEAAGAGTGVQAWIGVNAANTDPATWTTWVPATFNVQVGNNDEFQASIGSTLGAGTYYYASRWQLSTGEYRYGGYPNGYWNGTTQTSGVLTVTPTVVNDICSGAISLTVNADLACAVTTAGTTVGASQSSDLPAPTCSATGINDDVWFSFVATGASHVISITGATNTTAAQVYSGSCGTLNTIVCGSTTSGTANIIALGLVSGNTYLVRVYSTSTVLATTSNFTICIGTTPPPPANDDCSGAIVIPCDGSVSGNSSSATIDILPGITCGSTASTLGTNYGVWFTVTPALSGSMTISTCTATLYDTYLRVYAGSCGAFTTCMGFDDDACSESLYGLSSITFTAVGGTTYYILMGGYDNADFGNYTISATCPSACPAPATPTMSAVTTTTATATWAATGTFILEYGPTGYTPGTAGTAGAGGTLIDPAVSPQSITGLTAATTYDLYVRQVCTGPTWSANSAIRTFTTSALPPANDDAPGAITLTVNGTCTGGTYSNASATLGTTEPRISCKGSLTAGSIVWFKFVAPPSGFVKVTTDISGGSLTDTRIALFSAADVNDYSTFSILACDDDNGSVAGATSIFYANGLLPSNTYYIAVDHWNGSSTGTFCVEVKEFNSTMLSTATSCTAGQDLSAYRDNYTGWLSVTDNTGNLRALLRNPAGTGTSTYTYNNSMTINTGAVRQSSQTGTYYLDRNFRIANSAATNIDVQLFFLATETAALTTADGTSLASLAVTRQTEVVSGCHPNFVVGNGVTSVIPQNTNGTLSGVDWIQFNTPAFSNFYLNKVGEVLPVSVEYFKGSKQNNGHLLDWKVTCYNSPSVTMMLERSADGRKFTSISNQTETSLRCLQPFSFTDAAPLAGINYYRLKSIDIDGKESYSKIVALLNKEKGFEIVSLVPNPVKDEAVLSVSSATKSIIEIVVTDLSGKQLNKQRVSMIAGSNLLPINVRNLPAGTYQVTGITADGVTRTLRFVKQ